MNGPVRGLGRGLGALIPSAPPTPRLDAGAATVTVDTGQSETSTPGVSYAELPLDSVRPNPRQPRTVFDEDAMAELVASISEVGLLQPVVVRADGNGQYELVMGERRWRASKQAGLTRIPAIIRETAEDALLRDALLENVHRADLNALEEAAAYEQLLSDFGCTHEELAQRVGRSRPQISNTIRLLNLSAPVQRRVAAGVLSAGHARALLAIADTAEQDALAARTVAEGISVRGLEELISLRESPRRTRSKPSTSDNPDLTDIARRLEDRFETRCRVDMGKTKGRLTMEFASIDDLHRILAVMEQSSRSPSPQDQ